MNDKEAIDTKLVNAKLKELKKAAPDSDEYKALLTFTELSAKVKDYTKIVKDLNVALDEAEKGKYAELTIDEVKELLVNHKWYYTIFDGISALYSTTSHNMANRISELANRYESTLPSLEKALDNFEKKVRYHLDLLCGKKRLPGFVGEWKTISLGEIGTITGSGVDKKILPGETPITLLNYTNVYHQISIRRRDLNHRVTASPEKIKKCTTLKGDIFLTPTSETPEDIALSAVAIEDMPDVVYSYHVVRLRPNKEYNGNFINYALSTPLFREQATQFAEGSGIRYVITLKKFKEMKVHIPMDKNEQDAIVDILVDIDNEVEILEQKLEKCKKLKQGMMQQLLTGKIRLV